ncbi:MAG TPA: TetR/AcrR family transcriptional regulator [Ktedonobacterales bacterium]|nr:TetR/AcrR family transcriptional regulator [Ktedonobacterales bacterium]
MAAEEIGTTDAAGEAMAPISRREQKRDALRRRIYDAALELFRQRGVTHTTIRQITQVAHVGVGTFFNYFDSKEAVLAEFGEHQTARVAQLIEEPEFKAQPTRERIEALLRLLVAGVEAEPELARGVARAALRSRAVFDGERQLFIRFATLLTTVLREGQERGEVNPACDAAAAAQMIAITYAMLIIDWATSEQGRELLPALLTYIKALWVGMAPPNH